jgi:hypothetical protein
MAQTVNGKTVSLRRTVASGTSALEIEAAELAHATQIDAEIVAVGSSPTEIDTTTSRTLNGRLEMLTVMIWV